MNRILDRCDICSRRAWLIQDGGFAACEGCFPTLHVAYAEEQAAKKAALQQALYEARLAEEEQWLPPEG